MNKEKIMGLLKYCPKDVYIKIDGWVIDTGNSKPVSFRRRTILYKEGNCIALRSFENNSPTARELILEMLLNDGWSEVALYYDDEDDEL